jgi:hypothetical protein
VKKYRSHKIVEAAKITDVIGPERQLYIQGDTVSPTADWWDRYRIANQNYVGGYYVRYNDGYDSWSPAGAFEEGYVEVE